MNPTQYMKFVENEITKRFANSEYPGGEKATRIVPLICEPIMLNSDGSIPLCAHNGVRIDKVGLSYLCKVRWGAVQRGNVPSHVKNLDELAAHLEGQVELCLFVTDHIDGVTLSAVYKPDQNDSVEQSIRRILTLIAR